MNISPEFVEASAFIKSPQSVLLTITSAVALGTTAAKAYTVVPKGEMAVRMRKGVPVLRSDLTRRQVNEGDDIYKTLDPGFHWLMPFVDKIVTIPVSDNTNPLEEFDVESTDGRLHRINADITWFVRADADNPVKALFAVSSDKDKEEKDKLIELQQTVSAICARGLGQVLRARTSDELINHDHEEVDLNVKKKCEDQLLSYGTELKSVFLKPITRTGVERLSQAIENSEDPTHAGNLAAAISAGANGMGQIIPFPHDAA